MRKMGGLVLGVLAVAWAGTATALGVPYQPTPLDKCLAGRAEAWEKYEQCIQENVWKQFLRGFVPDSGREAKCRIWYAKAWGRLGALNTAPCSGNRFVDNTDGTVTDNLSGLTWEKKSDNGDIHDTDDLYTWSTGEPYPGYCTGTGSYVRGVDDLYTSSTGPPYKGDGTAYGTFLTTGLNATGFAGAKDWRLPTLAELGTILLPEDYPCTSADPCVPAVFNTNCTAGCTATVCSCTESQFYWSATPAIGRPGEAWFVYFYDGGTYEGDQPCFGAVRAVRGGL